MLDYWIIGELFSQLPSAQCLQTADSLPGASLRFSTNCIALTHCCQLHTRLVGPLSPPAGFCIGTPLFKKLLLACSHHASVVSSGKVLDSSQDVVSVYAGLSVHARVATFKSCSVCSGCIRVAARPPLKMICDNSLYIPGRFTFI